jgi:hypothetical protein
LRVRRLALCKSCPKNTEGFILVVLKPNHAARRKPTVLLP